ncbi:MAG: hypothetical protein MUC94_11420 [bacterium]|nr:hypothetical protein [bacterium]
MRTKLFVLSFILILLISLAVIFNGCKKEQEGEMEQPTEQAKTEMSLTEKLEHDFQDVIKPLDQRGSELKKEMDDLLFKIKNYEQTLVEKQKELSQQADSLNAKAQQLASKESSLKSYRTASWLILLIGLLLFIVGLVMVTRRKTALDSAEKNQRKPTRATKKE